MIVGGFLLYFGEALNVCWDTNDNQVLNEVPIKVEQVDPSLQWLTNAQIKAYWLQGIKSHRRYQLLLISIPQQVKGLSLPSATVYLHGLDSSNGVDPIILPALSAQQTQNQNEIAILVDCLCRLTSVKTANAEEPVLSSRMEP